MPIPWSDVFTGLGLILNIVGVGALTLTDIFSSKPIRTWWFYIRHVDRENPRETEKELEVDEISPVGGGYAGAAIPKSTKGYDNNKKALRNQSIAAIGLIGGFILQLAALLV